MLCPVALCVCGSCFFALHACHRLPPASNLSHTDSLHCTLHWTLYTAHCTQFFHTFNDFKSTQTTTQLFFTDMRHNVHPHTTCSQLSHTRQRDVTIPNWVLALLWYPSLCLLSKEVTLRGPFKTHGPGRVWTCRGGALHANGSLQPETFDVIDHCLFPKTAPNTFLKESQLQLAS